MTEVEWLAASDSESMLAFARAKVNVRKLRLFSAACFQRLSPLLPDPRQQHGIAMLEKLADEVVDRNGGQRIVVELRHAIPPDTARESPTPVADPYLVALMLYREFCSRTVAIHAVQATAGVADGTGEQRHQSHLLRDIVGNPFRPVALDPSWRTEAVVGLATGIYADRAFDRLPVLADALDDAGCADAELLAHCRSPGPHVRGCWAVDLLLGKS